ncbi:WD40 repeat-like protein [Paxillus ammoniavirescens]|nr:WD40 repeat-like protein [Paxillus ammoniavirescens]
MQSNASAAFQPSPPCPPAHPSESIDIHSSYRPVSQEVANDPLIFNMSASSQEVLSENPSRRAAVQVLVGHRNLVYCACFYPGENKLVTGSGDRTLRIWDWRTGAVVEILSGHTGEVSEVDVSRDGKMIVSGSRDSTVRIWDGESGKMMRVLKAHENPSGVVSVQFSPDGSRVVSGSCDGRVRVWLVEAGELVLECGPGSYGGACVRYSPDGDRIAFAARTIQIWDANTGVLGLEFRNSDVHSLAWTADGTQIIGGRKGSVTLWNSHNGERLHTWGAVHDVNGRISLSLSSSATHLATSDWGEKTAFVFDISTARGERIANLEHDQPVFGIATSPSGQLVATGCHDNKVYLWEVQVAVAHPKSPARSLSSPIDRSALAGPSRSDGTGIDQPYDDPTSDGEGLHVPSGVDKGKRRADDTSEDKDLYVPSSVDKGKQRADVFPNQGSDAPERAESHGDGQQQPDGERHDTGSQESPPDMSLSEIAGFRIINRGEVRTGLGDFEVIPISEGEASEIGDDWEHDEWETVNVNP